MVLAARGVLQLDSPSLFFPPSLKEAGIEIVEKLAFRSLCSIVSLPGLGAAFSPTLCQPWAPSCTRPCSEELGLPWVPFLSAPPRNLLCAPSPRELAQHTNATLGGGLRK